MKIHTRLKRKYGLTSSARHIRFFKGDNVRINGPKTFKNVESAKGYAKNKLGLKSEQYKLVPAKHNKKFKITLL